MSLSDLVEVGTWEARGRGGVGGGRVGGGVEVGAGAWVAWEAGAWGMMACETEGVAV